MKNKRPYRQRKRAVLQEETRRRIVEAAVDLHCSIGPARTTVSQIAERAGVQRNTYYAHFPEERDLFLACSGLALERDPLPDPEAWSELDVGPARIEAGLAAIYGWYERNRGQAEAVTRDMAVHDLTREMMELRFVPVFERAAAILAEGLSDKARCLLAVAFEYSTYRTLSPRHSPASAAALMTEAIASL